MSISVVVLDDHYLVRQGVRRCIENAVDIRIVAEGASGDELFPLIAQHHPDVLLLDLGMPQTTEQARPGSLEFSAFPAIARLQREHASTRTIILSQYGTKTLVESALETGVKGYLLKSDALTQNLVEAIRVVHWGGIYFSDAVGRQLFEMDLVEGSSPLTERQTEIIRAIAANPGLLQSEHAKRLGISEYTLKQHLSQIYRSLGVPNLTAAVIRAIQLKLVPLSYVIAVTDDLGSM